MPRLTQNARRSTRNSASTRNTSANPATPLRSISQSWLFSDSASFCHTVSVTPSSRRARAASTYCLASSAISTVLWSPVPKTETSIVGSEVREVYASATGSSVPKTETSIVGSESKRAYWSVSSKPSTTVATSPSRRRLPSARVHSGSASTCRQSPATLVESRLRDQFNLFAAINHRTDVPRRTDLGELPNYRTHAHTLFGQQEGCAPAARWRFRSGTSRSTS